MGGDDFLDSRDSGNDSLYGGSGDDSYIVKPGDQVFETLLDGATDAGGHDEIISYNFLNMATPGAAFVEDAWLGGNNAWNINGNALNNRLMGNPANNRLTGGIGDDTLIGGRGDDTLVGSGNTAAGDWVSYETAYGGVTVNLQNNTTLQDTGAAGFDLIQQVENVQGGRFADRLTGSAGANKIDGGNSNDTVNGGAGFDTLIGGAGRDQFVFDTTPGLSNWDMIVDFTPGQDKIVLDRSIYSALGGTVTSANFKVGVVPDSVNRVLLFAPGTASTAAKLYYDPDGNTLGGSGLQQIAAFAPTPAGAPPTLAFTDFLTIA
jgi:Ca2+-binding RTX toxin-like protein